MSRDYKAYLSDTLKAVQNVRKYTKQISYHKFCSDQKTVDAVLRNLEIIGEALKHIPEDFRKHHPEVEWKKISGLRDMLIHAYFQVDLQIVWDVIQNKLPDLHKKISAMLREK